MNYLIQAYACSPRLGGEYAVSWGWLSNLDRYVNENDTIYIVSLTLTNKDLLESSLKHVKLIPIKGMEKYKFLHYNTIYYTIWQRKAYWAVHKTQKKIDIVHIYSLSDFRRPGLWYKLKKSYTIFGPVGGGQCCPRSLRVYDDKMSFFRSTVNWICKYNFSYKKRIKKYSKCYVCNMETKEYIKKSDILIDVPLNDRFKDLKIIDKNSNIPIIVFVGRLIKKKGVLFLLDVLKHIDYSSEYRVLIYGEGKEKSTIAKRIIELGLQNIVELKGQIAYDEISKVYQYADIFVLPSLRESGGSVLIEAMAHKLPIVALKMSICRYLSEKKCGFFVETNQSKMAILKEFADCLNILLKNSELRNELGEHGYNFVNSELTWEKMIKNVYRTI